MNSAGIALALALPSLARSEYRAFWVDTFNTNLNNHGDVVAAVGQAKTSNANAIFAQVRRRGDSWYVKSLEPAPDFVPLETGFDAYAIAGAVWNKNPSFLPSSALGQPTSRDHVFNRHGGYDAVTRQIVPGPDNWLTRTLLPDGAGGISFQGHRIGAEFWIDFGHPDAAAYTVEVLMQLVRN